MVSTQNHKGCTYKAESSLYYCHSVIECIVMASLSIITVVLLLNSLVMAQNDISTKYGIDIGHPGSSCADIYNKNSASHGISTNYIIETDRLRFVYCDMELECGGTKGGWMRIANIDTRRGDQCPNGWTSYQSYCTGGQTAGCYSTYFSTVSTNYSRICGKVVGYQKGTMGAFFPSAKKHGKYPHDFTPATHSRSLDGVYVDGISITLGRPRKHVWTYAVGNSDDATSPHAANCPCAKHSGPDPPTYVANHYYCESGTNGPSNTVQFYKDDPLWDGAGCPPENSCCYNAGMPWFYRQLPIPENSDLEIRICQDQEFNDEGIAIEQIQLYVQ